MCGIAGCIGVKDIATINLMLDALPHRGPNDRGIHAFGEFVFGHTRSWQITATAALSVMERFIIFRLYGNNSLRNISLLPSPIQK